MAFKESSDRRIRYGRILGLGFIVAGFLVIALGWNGSAGQYCVDCQFPYLLSGGAAGIGLIVLGSTLLLISSLRAERMHLVDALERAGSQPASANGTASYTAAHTGASPNGHVVVGKASYHRPDCRLVKGKSDLEVATVEEAIASGLAACRVCSPAAADRSASSR